MSPFASALYQICLEENSTTSVELIRNSALAKIVAGGGEVATTVNTSLNGKSYSRTVNKSADVLFIDATAAIAQFNGRVIKATEVDFSGI